MARLAVILAVVGTAIASTSSGAAHETGLFVDYGPVRVLSPSFVYVSAGRFDPTTGAIGSAGLFIWNGARWERRSRFAPGDETFVDRNHGWATTWDCGTTRVVLHRTVDGGHTWRSLGVVDGHNCSAGSDSLLDFPDARQGWLVTLMPNGPVSRLWHTVDGGLHWREVNTELPCEGPVVFSSAQTGWIATTSALVLRGEPCVAVTHDGGVTWTKQELPEPPSWAGARLDVDQPRLLGRTVILPAIATLPGRTAAFFYTTSRAARHWRLASLRQIEVCPALLHPCSASALTSIAGRDTWWVVTNRSGRIYVTTDGGRHWRSRTAGILAAQGRCSPVALTASTDRTAWVTCSKAPIDEKLFATSDGGRTWAPVSLPFD